MFTSPPQIVIAIIASLVPEIATAEEPSPELERSARHAAKPNPTMQIAGAS